MNAISKSFALISIVFLSSCVEHPEDGKQRLFPVLTIKPASVKMQESYSASIQGCRDVDIYPQVSGTIARLCVKEGQKVREGETLFIIDQVPYQAALRTAVANVKAAEADVKTAELDYASKQELFREQVISEYELSVAENALLQSKARLEQTEAERVNAANSLSYTEVKRPSDGIIGTLPYREGALVGPSIPQPLTTVSDNRQMYVYFSMTENQLRTLVRQYGTLDETIKSMPVVKLQLNDGTLYEETGHIETISGVINRQTGTVSVKSVFPNAKQLLWSGGIGNVVIPYEMKDVIVIPQTATYELQDKIFAYKVQNFQSVSTELVVEKLNNGKEYVVLSGLSTGDVIVSEGVGALKDGETIRHKINEPAI